MKREPAVITVTISSKPETEDMSIPAYSALGQRTVLSSSLIRYGAKQRGFTVFLMLVVAMLALLNTHGYTDQLGPGLAIWIWTVSVFGLAAWYIGLIALHIPLKKVFPRLVAIIPLIGFVAMSFNTYLTMFHVSLYTSEPVLISAVIAHLPFNLSMGLIFETLFFTFVTPLLEREVALSARRPKDGKRVIRISGEEILVSTIILLKAQDHYVEIVTDSGRAMIRARIRDLVAQLTKDDGVMPHRSYWVAWRKINSFDMTHAYAALTMADGSVVPIAQNRKPEVETGVTFHQISATVG